MTLPTAIKSHVHISEREVAHTWPDGRTDDGKWEDCAWCSLLMFLRLTYRPDLKASHVFMEQLRGRVMGPLGGTVPSQLVAGAKTIGVSGPGTPGIALRGVSAANLWAALKPGTAACVAGSMGAFPLGYTLRRWDPSFAGGHQVLVVRVDGQDRVWWDDPLAPTGTYQGQWVTKADLVRFAARLNSTSFVAPIKGYAAPVPAPTPTPAPVPAPAPVPVPAPVPTPGTYTQDQLDAAVAAAVSNASSAATDAERYRLRHVLGI